MGWGHGERRQIGLPIAAGAEPPDLISYQNGGKEWLVIPDEIDKP